MPPECLWPNRPLRPGRARTADARAGTVDHVTNGTPARPTPCSAQTLPAQRPARPFSFQYTLPMFVAPILPASTSAGHTIFAARSADLRTDWDVEFIRRAIPPSLLPDESGVPVVSRSSPSSTSAPGIVV